MKLLNHTIAYLSIAFFVVIGAWAAVFYVNMLDEVYDSIDDELDNTKLLIMNRAQSDSLLDETSTFMETHYRLREISDEEAVLYRDVYTDSTMFMINEQEHEPIRMLTTAFRANNKYYELKIFSSMVEEDDLIEDLLYALIWLYVLLLCSIILINNFLLKRIWRPFYQTLERLKQFKIESGSTFETEPTSVSEFKLLNESIKDLLDRSVATFKSQKQFIENASHELQTPLAVSINRLELLAEREGLKETDLAEISNVIQSLERLTRLNKTLLLLSRIENRQFPQTDEVNFNDLADRLASEFEDLATYRSVKIECVHEVTLVRPVNTELASIMISNLIKNAIVHNVQEGNVTLYVRENGIAVENTGREFALDEASIFKRFYKESNSAASTGLGLSIVKSIADYYGFKTTYSYNGRHIFSIEMR